MALAILLLASVSMPAWGAQLTVNDSVDPGAVGDDRLSLSEAIRLATGDLLVTLLSAAELGQVSGGTPGAAAADTIEFDVPGSVAIAGNGTAELLPPLATGDDTIDGGGTTVLSAADVNAYGVLYGLRITSDRNTVRGLALEDFPGTALLVSPDPPGTTITGTRILQNRVTRASGDAVRLIGAALDGVGASITGGGLGDTLVEGNTFEAGTPDNLVRALTPAAMNVIASYAPATGTVSNVSITDTTIRDNVVRDIYYGIYVRSQDGEGDQTGNEIAGFTLAGNTFERVTDGCLVMAPSHVYGTGTAADNVLRDVVIADNTFAGRAPGAAEFFGGGIFVSAGFLASCFDTTSTPTSLRDRTSNVVISGNTLIDRGPYGIFLHASHSCGGAGGSLTDGVFEQVRVTGNEVANSVTGISLQGASTIGTGALLTNARNVLRDVVVEQNLFRDNQSAGVEILGTYAATYGGPSGVTSENVVQDVLVQANELSGNTHGVSIIGAISGTASVEVARNAVRNVGVLANRITGSSIAGVLVEGGNATASAADDNVVEAVTVADNTLELLQTVGIIVIAGIDGPGGKTRRNVITGTLLARNTIRDVTAGPPGLPGGTGVLLVGEPNDSLGMTRFEDNVIERVAWHGIELSRTKGHELYRNEVFEFGQRSFRGKKRKNRLVDNRFPKRKHRRRKRRALPAPSVLVQPEHARQRAPTPRP